MADLITKLGFLSGGARLRRIYEKLQMSGDRIYADSGLEFRSSWFPVYYTLTSAPAPLTVMEITDQIAFSHITVNNILKELLAKKLVKIEPNPDDRRSKLVSLTKKGEALRDKLTPIWERIADAIHDVFTTAHPEIIAILESIDEQLDEKSLYSRVMNKTR